MSVPKLILPTTATSLSFHQRQISSSSRLPDSIKTNSNLNPQSPSHATAGYIYLSKTKTRNFIMTDNFLLHAQALKNDPISNRSRPSRLDPASMLNTHHTPFLSPENTPRGPPLSPRDLALPSSERRSRNLSVMSSRDIFEELQAAGESHAKMNKLMTSLGHKKHELAKNDGRDKTSLLIKHHKHRLYGIDFINLRKVHSLYKPKESSPSNKETPKTPKETKQKGNLSPNKPTIITPIPLTKINTPRIPHPHEEDLAKNHALYTYNPVIDGFQYSGPNLSEVGQLIMSLTAHEERLSPGPRVSIKVPRRSKLKSQTMVPMGGASTLGISLAEMQTPRHQASLNLPSSVTNGRRSVGVESPKISSYFGAMTDRVERGSYPNISISAEENVEEQNKRIIAHTYRHHSDGGLVINSDEPVKEKMKKIDELCGKLEKQNKKMMRKVNRTGVKWGKEFKKLNNRVSSLIKSPLKS